MKRTLAVYSITSLFALLCSANAAVLTNNGDCIDAICVGSIIGNTAPGNRGVQIKTAFTCALANNSTFP